MNKVILMGRLARDPDYRSAATDQGTSVARYTLAVDRRRSKDQDPQADFISCVAFGKTADFVSQYLKKGTKILIEGRIQTGSYTNKEGQKIYTTDVVIENHYFTESKKAAGEAGTEEPEIAEDFMKIPEGIEEELPFV